MSPKVPAQPMAQPEHALFEPATQPLKQTSAQNTRTKRTSAEDTLERMRKGQALERFIACQLPRSDDRGLSNQA